MIGQGRPTMNGGAALVLLASQARLLVTQTLAILVSVVWLGSGFAAEDLSEIAKPATSETAVQDFASYDEATKPFELRSDESGWPLGVTGAECQLSVRVRGLIQHAGKDLVFRFELVRVEDGAVVEREQTDVRLDADGHSDRIPVASAVPADEGVYEIRCKLIEKSDRIWSRLARSDNELVSVQTPWLCYRQENKPHGNAVRSAASIRKWTAMGEIAELDPSTWQTLSWIPDGATRLVPNVRRVGESLTPWLDAQSADSPADPPERNRQLSPGKSFVGTLGDVQPHRPYQLTIALDRPLDDDQPGAVRVEFAGSPAFESITKSFTLDDQRRVDTATRDLISRTQSCVLYYPSQNNEFVRVTNRSDDQVVTLQSLRLLKQTDDTAPSLNPIAGRTVKLCVRDTNGILNLVDDHDRLDSLSRYSDATQKSFRLWKAIRRLREHSQWYGYDEISVSFDTQAFFRSRASGKTNDARSTDDCFAAISSEAAERWSSDSDLIVHWNAPESETPFAEGDVVIGSATTQSRIAGRATKEPNQQVVDGLSRTNPPQLTLFVDEFPLFADGSLLESVYQFRRTPVDSRPMGPELDSVGNLQLMASESVDQNTEPNGSKQSIGEQSVGEQSGGNNRYSTQLTIVNTAPWTSQLELRFPSGLVDECKRIEGSNFDGRDLELVSSAESASEKCVVILGPSSVANLKLASNTNSVRPTSWHSSIVGGAESFEQIKHHVRQVVGSIGTLAFPQEYKQLRNGSFENAGQVGIVGWMHTQFPESAVVVDSEEAIDGSHSIRMTTDTKSAGQTWLVSEPIPVPSSGRLAVSLAIRAGARSGVNGAAAGNTEGSSTAPADRSSTTEQNVPAAAASHLVRVSLEGNRNGKPIRLGTEFKVPADGQWQPRRIVLESESLNPDEIDSLRLTIDSLSAGRLWIDDVHLHDRFPTQAERTALQGNAFLAIQGLQQGNLQSAAQLLQNKWSKDLMARAQAERPAAETEMLRNTLLPARVTSLPGATTASPRVNAAKGQSKTPPPQPEARRESVAERLREWLPKPIRF